MAPEVCGLTAANVRVSGDGGSTAGRTMDAMRGIKGDVWSLGEYQSMDTLSVWARVHSKHTLLFLCMMSMLCSSKMCSVTWHATSVFESESHERLVKRMCAPSMPQV